MNGRFGQWARALSSRAGGRRTLAPVAALLLAAILLVIYRRPVFVVLVLAAWTFLLVRLICLTSVSLRTLATYLLLGTLVGTIVLPFVPTLVAPYASYDLLPRDGPILLMLVEALKIAAVLAPVAYLLNSRHAATPLRIVDVFLLAFMTGLGAELITSLLVASVAPSARLAALSWIPPWQMIRGARVVAGYAYWAGLTALALAAANRFLRDRRAVIAVAAIVFAYAVVDAAFAGSVVQRFTFGGRLTAWLTLAGAAAFSLFEARLARGAGSTVSGASGVGAAQNAVAGALPRRDRPLFTIRTIGQVALWLLLGFVLIVLPRLAQGLQASVWSTLLFRVGPSFLPTVINAALMLGLLAGFLLSAASPPTDDGTDASIAAFGARLSAKVALGAVATVLFGVALVDESPYHLLTPGFGDAQVATLLLLLTVAVTTTSSSSATKDAPAAGWRVLVLREGSRVTVLARSFATVWLALAFYRASASLITSLIGTERIYVATMFAALVTGGVGFALSYASGSFASQGRRVLATAKRLVPRGRSV